MEADLVLASGGVKEMQLPPNASIGGILEILAAINRRMAQPEESIYDGDKVAFFPPVTGG